MEQASSMNEKEADAIKTIASAYELLPQAEKKYILGYAEGVIAQAQAEREKTQTA